MHAALLLFALAPAYDLAPPIEVTQVQATPAVLSAQTFTATVTLGGCASGQCAAPARRVAVRAKGLVERLPARPLKRLRGFFRR